MNLHPDKLTSLAFNDKRDDNYYKQLKWQFALENSNIGIWDFDADLNKVFLSKESKKIIGFDSDEFHQNPNAWNDRVHPEDKEQYLQDFQDHLKGLKPIYQNEHRVQCKNGTYKWIADKGKIVEWADNGTPKRIIGTHTDITEIKEKEIQLANSLNIITNQNKKLLNFAHIVSHNLRTHSGNIESLVSLFEDTNNTKDKDLYFSNLKTVSKALSNSIESLNDIVKLETSKSTTNEALNLWQYAENAKKTLNHQIQQHNAIINNNIAKYLHITFNKAYLESIFHNLITNAIKFKKDHVNPIVTISSKELSDKVVINIEDNGIGIDLERYGNKLFGMYNTFHSKIGLDSQGIGLYLTKNQLEAHNGYITAKSKLGVGTTFMVVFSK